MKWSKSVVVKGLLCSPWVWATLPHHFDYQLRNVTLQRFDDTGHCIQQIHSPRLGFERKTSLTILEQPRIQAFGAQAWTLEADEAQSHKGPPFRFKGHVHLVQMYQGQPRTLTTQALLYDPKQQTAYTDDLVTLSQPGFAVTSRGFKANLAKARVELLAHIEGHYHAAAHAPLA